MQTGDNQPKFNMLTFEQLSHAYADYLESELIEAGSAAVREIMQGYYPALQYSDDLVEWHSRLAKHADNVLRKTEKDLTIKNWIITGVPIRGGGKTESYLLNMGGIINLCGDHHEN